MSSVFSPHWHRIADLRPALAPQVRVRRQHLRGQTWWLLADPLTGRSCRLDRAAYELAARLDGRHTLQTLWDQLRDRRDDAPTQDEALELLAQLREQGLVDAGGRADFDALQPHLATATQARARPNLLAWRIPLARPDALLRRLAPWTRPLFGRGAAVLLALLIGWLALAAPLHAAELWAYAQRWAMTPRFALIAALVYLPIKLLHELAHGLAVRQLGGPQGGMVREAGVTLMLGFPMPYVDASAASSWPERRRRMVVSAAGILLELAVAALALALWFVLDDGLAREAAFAAFTLGAVSTLVFNANPLQRLDGYHLLTDALQLPNLAPRSRAWWIDGLRRHLLRGSQRPPMPVAPGERPWLVAYAPLAWLWGLVIAGTAAAWLAGWSAPLGLAALLLLAGPLLVRPAWRLVADLRREARASGQPAPRLRLALAAATALAAAALVVPMPRQTLAQGVVWPPDHAQLRAESEGFVTGLQAADGQPVQPGDVVLTLANPQLVARHEQQAARVRGLRTQFLDAAAADAERGANLRAELQAAQAELAQLETRLQGLQLRAASAGRVALPDVRDLPGRWLARGQLIGQVLTGDAPVLRVALPDDQARGLRERLRGVQVRLAESGRVLGPGHDATLLRDGGGAVRELPAAALAQRHGGALLTDPQDEQDLRTVQPVVVLDLQLDAAARGARIGARGWARFDEGWSPWGWQLAQAAWHRWQQASAAQ